MEISETDDEPPTDGAWSNSLTGYPYQWKRDGSSIGGTAANTHVLVELDDGKPPPLNSPAPRRDH